MEQHPTYIEIQNRLTDPERLTKLTKIAAAAHKCSASEAEMIVNAEIQMYLQRLAVVDLNKHALTGERGINIFLEVLQEGMTFAPSADHVYLLPDFRNPGILAYEITATGDVYMANRAGAIKRVSIPVMVYAGDIFEAGASPTGAKMVLHKAQVHGETKPPIVAGYVYLIYPDGTQEPYWMDMADVARLRARSKRPTLYTSFNGGIDPGFFGTKLIKHALKNVRKKPVGLNAVTDDEDFAPMPDALPEADGTYAPTMVVEPVGQMPAQTIQQQYQQPAPTQWPPQTGQQWEQKPVPVPPGTTILPGQQWPPQPSQPAYQSQPAHAGNGQVKRDPF